MTVLAAILHGSGTVRKENIAAKKRRQSGQQVYGRELRQRLRRSDEKPPCLPKRWDFWQRYCMEG
ncbi:hypothetical protein HMPREF1986_00312 [Oribacterium sp. oral taxon 078 str. F0263]|nr:hypothetical protein HMPREF1986_00312 [Oribacterium sp. oral taxon 078 str. F0263]